MKPTSTPAGAHARFAEVMARRAAGGLPLRDVRFSRTDSTSARSAQRPRSFPGNLLRHAFSTARNDHPTLMSTPRSRALCLRLWPVLLLLAACRDDDVTSYRVPKAK